jgi:putative transposase
MPIYKTFTPEMRAYSNWQWHLDEVFVKINGERHYLWRAVDHEKSTNCMGEMIEQIWSRKTSAGLRADKSSVIRFGPVPQITIPARGFRKTAQRGLTEDRTRSQIHASETSCIFSGNHRRASGQTYRT